MSNLFFSREMATLCVCALHCEKVSNIFFRIFQANKHEKGELTQHFHSVFCFLEFRINIFCFVLSQLLPAAAGAAVTVAADCCCCLSLFCMSARRGLGNKLRNRQQQKNSCIRFSTVTPRTAHATS